MSDLEKHRFHNPFILHSNDKEKKLQAELFVKFKQIQQSMTEGDAPRKFISVTGSPSGLGNDLEAATSAVILAMVTGRGIMIE